MTYEHRITEWDLKCLLGDLQSPIGPRGEKVAVKVYSEDGWDELYELKQFSSICDGHFEAARHIIDIIPKLRETPDIPAIIKIQGTGESEGHETAYFYVWDTSVGFFFFFFFKY